MFKQGIVEQGNGFHMGERGQAGFMAKAAVVAITAVAIILIFGAWWMG